LLIALPPFVQTFRNIKEIFNFGLLTKADKMEENPEILDYKE
jgi:hypothetical protein